MCPSVKINYSAPALNTCAHRQALLQNVIPAKIQQQVVDQGETNDFLHFFTLPNNLNHNSIVRLPMHDTILYQLQYAGEHVIDEWREVKKERARKRKQRELRKKVEKMVWLHRLLNRELCQVHKLSLDGRGLPMRWWPVVGEWEEAGALVKIKRRSGQFL